MRIANFSASKDNNFNLLRMIAAFSVIISHCTPLTTRDTPEPFLSQIGLTIGNIAVDIFFITSGFLVTGSLLKKQRPLDFAIARTLRIYPALIPLAVFTLAIGLAFTNLSTQAFLNSPQTHNYFARCAMILPGCGDSLPDVFTENPRRYSINGSLWTLPFELRMYGLTLIAWLLARAASKDPSWLFKKILLVTCLISGAYVILKYALGQTPGNLGKLTFMYFMGAAFQIEKQRISISTWSALLVTAALILLAMLDSRAFLIGYSLAMAYLVFSFAFLPKGRVRLFNKLGDYSYGTYIYAFPIQQSISALMPGISGWVMFMLAAPATLGLAILSWHFIEKRVLSLKDRISARIAVTQQPSASSRLVDRKESQ